MSRSSAVALLLACLLPAFAWAEEVPLLETETVTCSQPALRVTRPDDAWQFVDLAAMRARAEQAGGDTRGYEVLRARLWSGAARADVYVRAWTDAVEREAPPAPAALILEVFEPVRASFGDDAKVKRPKGVRLGGRGGASIEVSGTLRSGGAHAVVLAAAYRPEDATVLTIALECKPDQVKQLLKPFKKLLKKLRF